MWLWALEHMLFCVERSLCMSFILVSRGRKTYNFYWCPTAQLGSSATLVWEPYTQETGLTFHFQVFSHSQFLKKRMGKHLVKPPEAESKVLHQSMSVNLLNYWWLITQKGARVDTSRLSYLKCQQPRNGPEMGTGKKTSKWQRTLKSLVWKMENNSLC